MEGDIDNYSSVVWGLVLAYHPQPRLAFHSGPSPYPTVPPPIAITFGYKAVT